MTDKAVSSSEAAEGSDKINQSPWVAPERISNGVLQAISYVRLFLYSCLWQMLLIKKVLRFFSETSSFPSPTDVEMHFKNLDSKSKQYIIKLLFNKSIDIIRLNHEFKKAALTGNSLVNMLRVENKAYTCVKKPCSDVSCQKANRSTTPTFRNESLTWSHSRKWLVGKIIPSQEVTAPSIETWFWAN